MQKTAYKFFTTILLTPIVIVLSLNQGKFIILVDHLNLLIHEGGHGVFSLFGRFLYTLGGTLMQILIPALVMIYFFLNKKIAGMQVSTVWLGQNFMNIGRYAADARAQALPLLGGKNVYHDWTYILNKLNILEYDAAVGVIFYVSGITIFAIALLLPIFIKNYGKIDLEMNL